MNDAFHGETDSSRFEEACDWFVRLREQPESSELVAAWLVWSRQDPRNRDAFEEARELWVTTGLIPQNAHQETLETTPRGAGGIVSPYATTASSYLRRRKVRLLAAAATVAAAVAGVAWLLMANPFGTGGSSDVSTFATARSERRSFLLADGSRIDMAGDSKLTVSLRASARDIELQQGEAYFSVAHDKARPFVVHAGALHVRAVGTRFDVRTSDDRVVVAVEEGVVVVEPPPERSSPMDSVLSTLRPSAASVRSKERLQPLNVRAGQEVAVGVPGHELQLMPIEPAAVASWREGRLRFAREPLRSVIASIRAASGQEIELADPALGDLRFTGTVFSSRVDAWVHGLPAIFPVTVRQDGAQIVIAPRD
ncbi:MAG TPA: FecR domain-containing protein [Steroidobacteraceae bacterium]|jgi:transmembrane sensor|nr:FecR domain-containing protein [Steroidobacteraceae bacterium]